METHLGRLGIAICEDLLWRSPVVEAAEDAGGKKEISDQNVDRGIGILLMLILNRDGHLADAVVLVGHVPSPARPQQ